MASAVSASVPLIMSDRAHVARRQLLGELAEVPKLIQEAGFDDPMTRRIGDWHRLFLRALRVDDIRAIQEDYTSTLQEMLCEEGEFIALLSNYLSDPITQAPLDEGAVLGSDGRVYGHQSLSVYCNHVDPAYLHRCPLDPTSAVPFITKPHPVVRYLVGWLKKYQALTPSPVIARAYQDLDDEKEVVALPTEESLQRHRLQETLADLASTDSDSDEEDPIAALHARGTEAIQETLDPLRARVINVHHDQQQRLDAVEETVLAARAVFQQRAQAADARVALLEADNRALRAQVQVVRSGISAVAQENVHLRIAINDAKKEKEESRSSDFSSLANAVAIVGVAAFSMWAFAQAGLLAGAVPTSDGAGAMLATVIST